MVLILQSSKNTRWCYRRAAECRARAEDANDPNIRQGLRDMEDHRYLSLLEAANLPSPRCSAKPGTQRISVDCGFSALVAARFQKGAVRWLHLTVVIVFAAVRLSFVLQNRDAVTMSFLGVSIRAPFCNPDRSCLAWAVTLRTSRNLWPSP